MPQPPDAPSALDFPADEVRRIADLVRKSGMVGDDEAAIEETTQEIIRLAQLLVKVGLRQHTVTK